MCDILPGWTKSEFGHGEINLKIIMWEGEAEKGKGERLLLGKTELNVFKFNFKRFLIDKSKRGRNSSWKEILDKGNRNGNS